MRTNILAACLSILVWHSAGATGVIRVHTTGLSVEVVDLAPADGIAAAATLRDAHVFGVHHNIRAGTWTGGVLDVIEDACNICEGPQTMESTHGYGSVRTSWEAGAGAVTQEVRAEPVFSASGYPVNWLYSSLFQQYAYDLTPRTRAVFRMTVAYEAELDFADSPSGSFVKSRVLINPRCVGTPYTYDCTQSLSLWSGSGSHHGVRELVFTFTNDTDGVDGAYLLPVLSTGMEVELGDGQLPVPEPSTYAMLAVGLALLRVLRARRS